MYYTHSLNECRAQYFISTYIHKNAVDTAVDVSYIHMIQLRCFIAPTNFGQKVRL